ncbi:FAD-dependent oxidoreductase domain-containing protein 1 [Tribolium castaneum]|uniref:FAD-dependent oxidoreductase domain-containing protein 1 n=1 Tax=Tribolium castaneum TaxID=7070 RepID=D6WMM3_TRICA|nr:PREDICTED: FAD-dependent oxidoreductase domain-containing protein 1 [Tribolium castaneum]EFA04295.1 FAD-dependent oxidoreductase domain-containing protein 1-like Protein [Tribolium castaneum]|eukprot:XP_970052.1 PREDICTED: FAD-dependent oxidoreductase domain-containing protein 1 [Tribolium castaneum]
MFTRQATKVLRSLRKDKTCVRIEKRNHPITRNSSTNVVIIGGGAMGASAAYWLTHKSPGTCTVTVVEKDPTYANCSTSRSVGGIRQQFSIPENVQMSLFGAKFIQNLKNQFGPEADIAYAPNGYLILASPQGAPQLAQNFKLQQELGATNTLLSKDQLREKFKWLNVDDIELGSMGCEKEGWFDPWGLLSLFKSAAVSKGAQFVHGEVQNFVFTNDNSLKGVKVRLPNRDEKILEFDACVLAAGAQSGAIARMAGIGTGAGDLSVALPVEPRKRYVYRFDSQGKNVPPVNSPLMIDYTGVYFRKDGPVFIGGRSPDSDEEPQADNLEVDFSYFDNTVWPLLAARIPAFESVKVQSAWGGFYEYNTFDANGFIGPHCTYDNLFFATGFSGHGIQQSPAVGLAIAELILDGRFKTIDLKRMGFERLMKQQPLYEIGIY